MERKYLAKPAELKMDGDGEGRTIFGYMATWDEDSIGDIIVPGAFAKTIAERGPRETPDGIRSQIKIGYNHGKIIGIPTVLKEDDTGLYYEGRIANTQLGNEVLQLVKEGVVDVNSFAFDIIKSDEKDGKRYLKELKVYEGGPVDFACNEVAWMGGAKADQVRRSHLLSQLTRELKTIDPQALRGDLKTQFEEVHERLADLLRKAGGPAPPPGGKALADDEGTEILEKLRSLSSLLKGNQ